MEIVETSFEKDDYGYLMVQMILDSAKNSFDKVILNSWVKDLEEKAEKNDFYFAIDVMIAKVVRRD